MCRRFTLPKIKNKRTQTAAPDSSHHLRSIHKYNQQTTTAAPEASPKVAKLSEEILSLNMLELGQLLKVLKVRWTAKKEA